MQDTISTTTTHHEIRRQ